MCKDALLEHRDKDMRHAEVVLCCQTIKDLLGYIKYNTAYGSNYPKCSALRPVVRYSRELNSHLGT